MSPLFLFSLPGRGNRETIEVEYCFILIRYPSEPRVSSPSQNDLFLLVKRSHFLHKRKRAT